MLRPLTQGVRCAARSFAFRQQPVSRSPAVTSFRLQRVAPTLPIIARRGYASANEMQKDEVEGRIMDLLKGFDKIKDVSKLQSSSNFANDLGLDSLDTVEVVMAIEEEFSIEIPDKQADGIHSVNQAVDYIMAQPDAH